jgi:hypothetical protein
MACPGVSEMGAAAGDTAALDTRQSSFPNACDMCVTYTQCNARQNMHNVLLRHSIHIVLLQYSQCNAHHSIRNVLLYHDIHNVMHTTHCGSQSVRKGHQAPQAIKHGKVLWYTSYINNVM